LPDVDENVTARMPRFKGRRTKTAIIRTANGLGCSP
jgi:hypothetical protein